MNNGQPIKLNLKELTPKEKENFAKDFSEGLIELKNLLLKMWNNGIETYACCAGHDKVTKGVNRCLYPYIFFEVSNFNKEELKNLLNRLMICKRKDIFSVSFSIDFMHENQYERKGVMINSVKDNFSSKEFFTLVEEVLFGNDENIKLTKMENDIISSAIKIFNLNLIKYLELSKNKPSHQFSSIMMYSIDDEYRIVVKNNCNYKIYKEEDKQGNIFGYFLAEGYYCKTKKGEYYTLKNNKFIKLNLDELKDYKQYRVFKKYTFDKIFSDKIVDDIISLIKSDI